MTFGPSQTGRSRLPRLTLKLLGVLAVIAGCGVCWQLYFTPEEQAGRHRVAEANAKSLAAINQRLQPLEDLFARGRKGAEPFAQEALSWSGKWSLVKSMLPFGEGNSHRDFLTEAFARDVFDQKELQEAMEGAVRAYLTDLEAVDNEMLVKLRADLADFDHSGQPLPSHLQSDEAFRQEYRKLAENVAATMQSDLGISLVRDVGILVTSEVAAQVVVQAARAAATEMGVEAGVLGSGVGSTLATLGVGMVVAVILDYVIDGVFKLVGYDPTANIAKEVRNSLDKLESALTHKPGFLWDTTPGALRGQMNRLHEARAKLRRETVDLILKEGSK